MTQSTTLDGASKDDLEEQLQTEHSLLDDNKDTGSVDLGELSDDATKISDISRDSHSPSDSGPWVIDSTLGNIFSQIFQNPGDEIAFTYCKWSTDIASAI